MNAPRPTRPANPPAPRRRRATDNWCFTCGFIHDPARSCPEPAPYYGENP